MKEHKIFLVEARIPGGPRRAVCFRLTREEADSVVASGGLYDAKVVELGETIENGQDGLDPVDFLFGEVLALTRFSAHGYVALGAEVTRRLRYYKNAADDLSRDWARRSRTLASPPGMPAVAFRLTGPLTVPGTMVGLFDKPDGEKP